MHAVAEHPHERSWPSLTHVLAVTALIVIVLLFGIFGVTPDGNGLLQPVDNVLSSWLHVTDVRPSLLLHALSSPVLPAIAAVAVAMSWRRRAAGWKWLLPLVVTAISGSVAWSLAAIVSRPSPGHLGDLAAADATTFPSVVAAMTAALAFTVAGSTRLILRPCGFYRSAGLAAAAAFVAAAPGVLTATAWPLDVAAGAAIGIAIAGLTRPTRFEGRRAHRTGRPGARWIALTSLVVLVVPASFSYAQILAARGNAPVDQRTIEWLRDHGMNAFVDRGESWWLWRHLPSTTAVITSLPAAPVHVAGATTVTTDMLPTVHGPIQPGLRHEGRWSVAAVDGHGTPEIATTFFRPDRSHPSVLVGVAWINASNTKISLIAGTRQPGGGVGPAGGHVPASALGSLLAAFNSGYKMKDTPGGALEEGHLTRHFVNGLATLVVLPDGTAKIGAWGTDLDPRGAYVAVRQNLHLMVVHGAPVSGVATNAGARWGFVKNALPAWRSGLGVTARGDLVYVGGNQLTLGVLAKALIDAGAVTAMELDIHRGMVTFNLFTHDHGVVGGHKLLPDTSTSANRYLTPDWRDFVMVTSR